MTSGADELKHSQSWVSEMQPTANGTQMLAFPEAGAFEALRMEARRKRQDLSGAGHCQHTLGRAYDGHADAGHFEATGTAAIPIRGRVSRSHTL